MNELQTVKQALETAFQALDAVPVYGVGVELMATARASLRAAYSVAERAERGEPAQKGGEA